MGGFPCGSAGARVDIRVSTLPSANGERVVLRLLDKQAGRLNLQHLGMSERDRKLMDETVRKPHGILLVTGPTGSGKTTTLYASLTTLNDRTRNILTVGDPIRIPPGGHRPDPGQRQGRHDLRPRPAGDPPAGPGRGDGRRIRDRETAGSRCRLR